MTEYTLLEAARELGFTKNAVKYRVQKLPPNVLRKSEEGIIYITAAGIELLREQMGKKSQPDKETASTTQQPTNNRTTTDQEPPKEEDQPNNNHEKTNKEPATDSFSTTEKPANNQQTTTKEPIEKPSSAAGTTTENAALIAAVEALTAQLAVKDEQIASQARQIETLVESLKLAQQTAAAAQALHAGTIQKELSAAQSEPAACAEPIQNEENICEISQEKPTLIQRIRGYFSKK